MLDKDLVNLQLDGLSLDDFLLDSVLGHQPVNVDILALTDSMRSIHCLQVDLRVEVGIKEYNVVGRHQVDTQAACSRRDQEDGLVRASPCKVFDLHLAVRQLRTSIEAAIRDLSHRAKVLHDREHLCEAREENDLLVDCSHLLQELVKEDHLA